VEEAVRQEQQRGRPILARSPLEPADHRGHERPADAERRPEPGRHDVLPVVVLRIGEALEAVPESCSERVRILDVVGDLGTDAFGERLALRDERHSARGGRAGRLGGVEDRHQDGPSTRPGITPATLGW
jgi:hypothetical protein